MSATEEGHPTKEERRLLGIELLEALQPVLAKHEGIEIVLSFIMPRDTSGSFATCLVATMQNPHKIVHILLHNIVEVKEQMIDPFSMHKERS